MRTEDAPPLLKAGTSEDMHCPNQLRAQDTGNFWRWQQTTTRD